MNAWRIHILCLVLLVAAVSLGGPVVAQEAPLGQPAGWVVEDSVSLVAIASGSELYAEPDPAAMMLTILPGSQLPLIETRGSWVKVRFGDRVGWVDLEGARGPGPGPAPPVRVVVVEAEPEPLELGPGWPEGEVGPYKLFSKVDEPALFEELGRVARQHLQLYSERYGLKVDSEILGSVVMFPSRQSFLEFQEARGHGVVENRIDAYFHSPDTVVMYRGSNPRHKLAATLLHELTHLVSWQALRAGGKIMTPLPPWLAEGMAEDLSLSRLDRKGRLVATPLGLTNLRYGQRLGATLLRLEIQVSLGGTAPSLPQLLAMDEVAFLGSQDQLNYLMSAMWVRYLLNDADSPLAAGFRDFLASVADGGSSDAEELRSRLGRSWDQLSQGFRGWLVVEKARVGL